MSKLRVDQIQSTQHATSTIDLTSSGAAVNGDCSATTFTGDGSNLTNLPVDLTNLNADHLTSGSIPDARFPATLPAVDGSNLTGISSGALEHVNDYVVPTGTYVSQINIPHATGHVEDDNTYLLKGYLHNNIGAGPYTNIYPIILDGNGSTYDINTGLSYCETYTTSLNAVHSNQSSSYWQLYDGGYTAAWTYVEIKFSTYLGVICYTKSRGLDYTHHLVDGCHSWTSNRTSSRMRGMAITNHYAWNWDDKTKLSLYKYSKY